MFLGCVFVEHETADDRKGEGGLGFGISLVGAGRAQQLSELRKPVVDAFSTESREPLGLGLGERVDLIKESKEGTVGGVGDDRAQRRDQGLEIVRVLHGEPVAAVAQQLASSVGKSRGDQGVAGAEMMDEHP